MSKYRKILMAAIGLVAITLNDAFGVSALVGMEEMLGQIIISLLTAWGVWGVANE